MRTFALAVSLFIASLASGQATENYIDFNGQTRPSFSVRLDAPKDVVFRILQDYFPGIDEKMERKDGYIRYMKTRNQRVSGDYADIYIQIKPELTINSSATVFQLLVSKGYENFVSSQNDTMISGNLLLLMDEVATKSKVESLKSEIARKELSMDEEKKKQENLLLQKENINASINDLQVKLNRTQTDIQVQSSIINGRASEIERLKFSLKENEDTLEKQKKESLATSKL